MIRHGAKNVLSSPGVGHHVVEVIISHEPTFWVQLNSLEKFLVRPGALTLLSFWLVGDEFKFHGIKVPLAKPDAVLEIQIEIAA